MNRFTYTLILNISLLFALSGQDSLTVADMAEHTYHFTIDDGRLKGRGAQFLREEINHNQYFLLGEYHNSPRISTLTKALLPVFSAAGGRHLALEVGPVSVEMLSEFAAEPNATTKEHGVGSVHCFTIPHFSPICLIGWLLPDPQTKG